MVSLHRRWFRRPCATTENLTHDHEAECSGEASIVLEVWWPTLLSYSLKGQNSCHARAVWPCSWPWARTAAIPISLPKKLVSALLQPATTWRHYTGQDFYVFDTREGEGSTNQRAFNSPWLPVKIFLL